MEAEAWWRHRSIECMSDWMCGAGTSCTALCNLLIVYIVLTPPSRHASPSEHSVYYTLREG